MTEFETWWYNEGSGPAKPGEDGEEHCKRMCQIAWSNGAYLTREACAKVADRYVGADPIADAIRAGGEA